MRIRGSHHRSPARRWRRSGGLLLAAVLCAACGRDAAWVRTELAFGRSMPGGEVDDAAWTSFVAAEIAPRLPDGFTVVDARGQWRDPAGAVVAERSVFVIVVHPASGDADAAIEAVRAAYRRAFHQQSVLRIDQPASVKF
jgi:hypothetical protein